MGIKVLDCTLRDGGNVNNWDFNAKDIKYIVDEMDKSRVDIIEVGYRGGSGSNTVKSEGLALNSSLEYLQSFSNMNAEIAVMIVPTVCPIEKIQDIKDSPIKLARIASYYNDIKGIEPYIKYLKRIGLKVSINLMAVSYVDVEQVIEVAKNVSKMGVDIFYIADSYGAFLPEDVKTYIESIVEQVNMEVGFHGHNNLGLAFTNTIQAINSGATYIDTALCGMARGAGNLPTEQLLPILKKSKQQNYEVSNILRASEYVLNEILRQPIKISKKEIECGLYNIHYYYYDLLMKACCQENRDPYVVGKLLGEQRPPSINEYYIARACEQSQMLK